MDKVIDWDKLIVPNKDIKVTKVHVLGNEVLILDNVLTKESFRMLSSTSKELTKSQYSSPPKDGGFVDARFQGVQHIRPISDIVIKCIRQYLGREAGILDSFTWAINYFKSLSTGKAFIGGHPHIDNLGEGFAALLYLNDYNTGGTAFYSSKSGVSRVLHSGQRALNKYGTDYRLTAEDFEEGYEAREVIEGVPNRMVIYRGSIYHGANHTEKEHIEDYRMTLISFYNDLFSVS